MRSIYRFLSAKLDIFVLDTSIARNLDLPGLEKNHFSYIRIHTHFFDQVCVTQNQRTFKDQGLIIDIKKISVLIKD